MMHLISVVALPAFLLSILMLGLEGDLFSSAPGVIACQVGGLAVAVWARTVFPKGSFRVAAKPAGSVMIQTGPYRFIRHPMYAGALLILWGSIAGHVSIANVGIGFVVSLVVLGKIIVEEQLLRASFPGYEQYARSTKAVIPFVL
jgi:protein-S-isoprenylcysteine O-methyltransferase Ste14